MSQTYRATALPVVPLADGRASPLALSKAPRICTGATDVSTRALEIAARANTVRAQRRRGRVRLAATVS
jgi:hypothetical protein